MSACGMRIFLVIGLCWMVSTASAQDRLLSNGELDGLKTWYPVSKPTPVPGMKMPEQFRPTGFETIAQLVDSIARRESVQAVRITADVLQKGNGERLAELNGLRILYLEVDSVTATAALGRTIGQLKRLQRLSIFQNKSVLLSPAFSVELAASLKQLAQLQQLQLQVRLANYGPVLTTMPAMATLRKLVFSVNGKEPTDIPSELGNLRQLTSLTIQSSSPQIQLPASLGALTQLKELTLNYLQLRPNVDWAFLNTLTELETLRLENTRLSSVPNLKKLKKLRTLALQYNDHLVISDDFFSGLNELENLNLSGCRLRQLPATIAELSGLKELMLNNNPLSELPTDVGSMKQLEVLQANGCQLRKLPESMGSLIRLHNLNLSNNQIDTLNFDLGNLASLTYLSLYNNQLQYLPSSIGRLTALNQLYLSNNRLVELPESIATITKLNRLSITNNRLTHLPTGFGNLTKLQELDLMENQLQQLPAGISKLRRLKQLSLSSNKLTQLPEELSEMDSLNEINLSRNQLTEIPDALFRLSRLHNLNLNDNKLTTLPAALGNLANLTNLTLGNNRLSRLPAEIGKLTNLRWLWMGSNPLESLPETITQCRELVSLYAQNTKLKALPAGIVRLTKLQDLELSGNELTVLPTSLGDLSELRTLHLGRTRLLALPESIGRLTHLTSLKIGEMEEVSTTPQTGLRQLPDSIVYCQEITNLQLMNQSELEGDDTFAKVSKLPKLRNLTLFHCNLKRIPPMDWKNFPVWDLSLMQNQLTELPVEILESPKIQRIALYENLLPQPLNTNFNNKEALRLAFSEAGLLSLDKIAKPNRNIANSFVQMAFQKAGQRNWTEAFANFEKAIDYASDTLRIVLYAQRADMHVFRQEYKAAIADYDQSVLMAERLLKGGAAQHQQWVQNQQFDQTTAGVLRGRAHAKGKLGQLEAAMADIDRAIQKLNGRNANPQLIGSLYTEQGRFFTLRNKVNEANVSYRKTIEEYEKLHYTNPATRLTVVELYILVGQPDDARKALQRIDKRELTGGFAILEKYLECSIQVLKKEKPDAEVLADLTSYLATHSERIVGWSFELYENWLGRSGLPIEKQTVLQQMTQLTKERVPKMD